MSTVENRFVTEKQVMEGFKLCGGILPKLLGEVDAVPPLAFYNGKWYRSVGFWHPHRETPSQDVVAIREKGCIPGVWATYAPDARRRINANGAPTVDMHCFGLWQEVMKTPKYLQQTLGAKDV